MSKTMTLAQAQAIIAAQQAELESQRNGAPRISILVGKHGKGNVCVYGLQRMPVSLYPEQWAKLLDAKDRILRFIDEHRSDLSFK